MQTNTLINTSTGRPIDLAMQSLEVAGHLYSIGSFVRVTHRFRCLGSTPMEAIYVSQLPTGGVLRRFKIIGEDFEKVSKLEKRSQARAQYEEGVSQGHLSALAETNIDGLVNLTVGQVQPDEEISVVMDIVVGVDTKDKGFRFRFPFTLAPNYHSQTRVSVTPTGISMDLPSSVFGDLLLPEWKTATFGLHEVRFDLVCHGGSDLATISSPSHRITVAPQVDGSKRVTLAGMGDTPNRDLVIDVSVPEATPILFTDTTLLGGQSEQPTVPEGAPRWTTLIPSSKFPKAGKQPRRICFLIDRSGSMNDYAASGITRINHAKRALQGCLDLLQPEDEFGMVHFGSDSVDFHPSLAKASEKNKARAGAWVKDIRVSGGTEMLTALSKATSVLGGPGDIFLITDGEVWQTGPIVEHMASSKSRVHVLGIGDAAQHRFMAQLARRTKGVSAMVGGNEDVATAGLSLFSKVAQPLLTNTTAIINGQVVEHLGTVWEGSPLLVNDPCGDGSLPSTVLVNGVGLKDHVVHSFVQIQVPDGLAALLAAGRLLEDLSSKLDMSRAGPQREGIEKEMEDLSIAYSLASRVMSLVAVVERIGDQAGVAPLQSIVPVGMPEGREVSSVSHQSLLSAAPSIANTRTITRGLPRGIIRKELERSMTSPVRRRRDYTSRGLGAYLSKGVPISNDASLSFMAGDVLHEAGDSIRGIGFADDVQMISESASTSYCVSANCFEEEVDDGTFNYIGDVQGSLFNNMETDGGVRGVDLETRVLHTTIFMLIVALEYEGTSPDVQTLNAINAMFAFLDKNKRSIKGRAVTIHKAIVAAKAIKAGTYGLSLTEHGLSKMFCVSFSDAWTRLRSAIH